MLFLRRESGAGEVHAAERHGGIEHAQLAAGVLERLRLLPRLSRSARGDAVTVRAEDGAAVLPEDLPFKSIDGI